MTYWRLSEAILLCDQQHSTGSVQQTPDSLGVDLGFLGRVSGASIPRRPGPDKAPAPSLVVYKLWSEGPQHCFGTASRACYNINTLGSWFMIGKHFVLQANLLFFKVCFDSQPEVIEVRHYLHYQPLALQNISQGGVAINNICPKLILNSILMKYCLSITYFTNAK